MPDGRIARSVVVHVKTDRTRASGSPSQIAFACRQRAACGVAIPRWRRRMGVRTAIPRIVALHQCRRLRIAGLRSGVTEHANGRQPGKLPIEIDAVENRLAICRTRRACNARRRRAAGPAHCCRIARYIEGVVQRDNLRAGQRRLIGFAAFGLRSALWYRQEELQQRITRARRVTEQHRRVIRCRRCIAEDRGRGGGDTERANAHQDQQSKQGEAVSHRSHQRHCRSSIVETAQSLNG